MHSTIRKNQLPSMHKKKYNINILIGVYNI